MKFRDLRVLPFAFLALFACCALLGCAHPILNEKADRQVESLDSADLEIVNDPRVQWAALDSFRADGFAERPFIGIAISGGGSRAANLGAAVLLELERLDILKHVSTVSAVSGGSMIAAYYGLFGADSKRWAPEQVRAKLSTDFENLLTSHVLLSFGQTHRTYAFAEILDHVLFEGRRFRDLKKSVLINATIDDSSNGTFVFREEEFQWLQSRLDSYPIAGAVAASASFPGIFPSLVLRVHRNPEPQYLHLFDGGVRDNLGIDTLNNAYLSTVSGRQGPARACLFIIVNAELSGKLDELRALKSEDRRDGFIIDFNAVRATDQMYRSSRAISELLYQIDQPAVNPLVPFRIAEPGLPRLPRWTGMSWSIPQVPTDRYCLGWEISLERLAKIAPLLPLHEREKYENHPVADQVPTRLALKGPPGFTSGEIQDAIFRAAEHLFFGDPDRPLLFVCRWFLENKLADKSSPCGRLLEDSTRIKATTYFTNVFAQSWKRGHWQSFEQFGNLSTASFVDTTRKSSIISSQVSIDLGSALAFGRSGHRIRGTLQVDGLQGDELARETLMQLVSKTARWSPPNEVGMEYGFKYVTQHSSKRGLASSLVMRYPLAPIEITKVGIGGSDYHSTEFEAIDYHTGAVVMVKAFISQPVRKDAGNVLQFDLIYSCVPVSAPDEVSRSAAEFIVSLARGDSGYHRFPDLIPIDK